MIRFLDLPAILSFHQDLINLYGGAPGIRDLGMLESALAQPQTTNQGEYLHKDLFHMAAAYGFHICQNHPFFDGNKRTALVATYTFLYVNGYRLEADKKSLYAIISDLANGKVSKNELAGYLKTFSRKH